MITAFGETLCVPGRSGEKFSTGTPEDFRHDASGSPPGRVSFRVSLRWQNPKTDANGRKDPAKSENAKLLAARELNEKASVSGGF